MSSLKDSEEQTSPPVTDGSLGVQVANSHFSKIRARRGKSGCLKIIHRIRTLLLFSNNFEYINSWSSLVVGDEGHIGQSRKLLRLCHTPNNYAAHARPTHMFNCWVDPVVHLLLLKSSMINSFECATQRTLTAGARITVRLDSILIWPNKKISYFYVHRNYWIQTSQTEDQPDSDPSPYGAINEYLKSVFFIWEGLKSGKLPFLELMYLKAQTVARENVVLMCW